MSGTYQVVVGDRGRLVVPAEVRARAGIAEGTARLDTDAWTADVTWGTGDGIRQIR